MKKASQLFVWGTFLCTLVQTIACVFGTLIGFADSGTKELRAQTMTPKDFAEVEQVTDVRCQPPFSRLVDYVVPGYRLGCWLSKPGR